MNLARYPKEALLYFLSEINGLDQGDLAISKTKLLNRIRKNQDIRTALQILIETISIFSDSRFIDCWNAAFPNDGTVCLKTSFGACAYDENDRLIAHANNKRICKVLGINPVLCGEEIGCIRQIFPSRTDQTIGECNHSIVWLLRYLFDLGYKPSTLSRVKIYEAGFLINQGLQPWWRKVDNYTCLYCVRIFLTFNLSVVYGVVGEKAQARWQALAVEADYQKLARQELKEGDLNDEKSVLRKTSDCAPPLLVQ